MKRLLGVSAPLVWVLLQVTPLAGQQPTAPAAAVSRVIGEVSAIDSAGARITLKPDKGDPVVVQLGEKTLYLRVPPGEKDLKKANRITLADIGQGDRLLARGRLSEDQKTLSAAAVIVMTKSDLAAKQAHDREEWQRRGMAGTVAAVSPETRQITMTVRNFQGARTVTIDVPEGARFRRYAPDSVRFSDAQPSSLAELKAGDHLRVLGEKNEDGSRIKAEQIVFGSFRTIAGTVLKVDAAANEVSIKELATNKPLTVKINADSTLRRLPPMMAAMMARRLNPEAAGGNAGRGPAGPGGPQGEPYRASERPPGQGGADGQRPVWAGMRGQAAQGRGDFQQMLERMPAFTLAELKPGDALVVSSTAGAQPTQVTAITVVAGVEPLLTASPQGGRQVGGAWNFGDIGLPE